MKLTIDEKNENEFIIRHRTNRYKHYKITIYKDNESIAKITGPKDKEIKVDAYGEINRLFKSLTKYGNENKHNEPSIRNIK